MNKKLKFIVNSLPRSPGVYLFKNLNSEIIYVGKAVNLKHRVGSYFIKKFKKNSKTQLLVSNIYILDFILTESEIEALILEAELIKKYKPKFNILQKDDKSYLFIVIRKETDKLLTKIPKVVTARKPDLTAKDIVFGPYPDGATAKSLLRTIRSIFPFRDCSITKFKRYSTINKPCLYGHLGLCLAPCLKNTDNKIYIDNIRKLKEFLKGKSQIIYKDYKRKMSKASKELDYEKAANYRNLLYKINYMRTNFKSAQSYLDNPRLVYDLAEESLKYITKNIEILSKSPQRIECYDISNISGKEAVGSMVVATNGRIDKSQYRKFKLKYNKKPNDYYMLEEVLTRRFVREISKDKKKWGKPDLIILDGGKGQLSSGLKVLKKLKIEIPAIGLAKKYETIIYKNDTNFVEKSISKDDPGLKLIINLRDEAHRFAKNYHTHLRLKKIQV